MSILPVPSSRRLRFSFVFTYCHSKNASLLTLQNWSLNLKSFESQKYFEKESINFNKGNQREKVEVNEDISNICFKLVFYRIKGNSNFWTLLKICLTNLDGSCHKGTSNTIVSWKLSSLSLLKAKKLVHNLTTCAVQILWKDFKRS